MKMATTIGQMIHKIPIKQIARVATPALLGTSVMAEIGDLALDTQSQYAMEKAPIPTSGMSSLFSLTNITTTKNAPEGLPKEEYGFNLLDLYQKFMPSIPSNAQSDSITTDDIQTVPPGMELKYQDSYGTLKKGTPVHWYERGVDWQREVAQISKSWTEISNEANNAILNFQFTLISLLT